MKQKSHILLYLKGLLAVFILIAALGATAFGATYYGLNGATPSAVASWGTTTGGGGAHPANFTTAGDIFIIENGTSMTASAAWLIGAAGNTASTLQINSGGTLAMGNRLLTLASCNFTNSGTFTSTTGGVTISGTLAANSIDDFTTTGAITISKTTGTVAIIGNVNGTSITFPTAQTANVTVSLNAGVGLTLTGAVTMARPNTRGSILSVGAGSLSCASISLGGTGTTAARSTTVLVSTGTISVSGNITSAGIYSYLTFSGAGTLNAGGTFMSVTAGTFTCSTGTVNFNANAAQTIAPFSYTFNNVMLSGSGAKTLTNATIGGNLVLSNGSTVTVVTAAALAVGGNLTVGDGTTLTAGAFALSVTGTTTIGSGSGSTARLTTNSATGTKSFTGTMTINSNGVLSETAAAQLAFGSDVTIMGTLTENTTAVVGIAGSLTNNGTYTASTGTHTFSGANKTIGGFAAISIPTATFTSAYSNNGTFTVGTLLTVTGTTLTNNGTITASTALSGTGGVTQGTTGILNIGGTSGITTLTATAAGNTVNFTGGAAQTIPGITYYDLGFSGAGTKTIATGTTITVGNNWAVGSATAMAGTANATITGNITGAGAITMGSGTITVEGDFSNSGTFASGTGTVNYDGSSANQSVRGGITYYNLQVSNGSTKLLQTGNVIVSNALNLTSCTITTNAYSLSVSTGTVNRTSGYVIGNLNLSFATGATSHTFDIGDAFAYTPVAVSFANVTTAGSLTVTTTAGDHPQIFSSGLNNSKSANRYWILANSGIVFTTYNVVFTFVPADLDGSAVPASFSVGRYNTGAWSTPTIGTRTATTTQATGLAAFGDFQLGNIQSSGVSNYTPTRTTGITYSSIAVTGNAVESWRTSSISDNSYYDDNRSFPVPIGFDFWYDGTRYTQFSASTNGFMDFDASSWNGGSGSVQPNNPYGPYSTDFVNPTRSAPSGGVGTVTALAPLYYDLTTWQTTVPLGNSVKYLLTGTAPNRVLTVEWINMSTWTNQADTLNFQVKLYESTGIIEYYYGYMSGTISTGYGFGYVTGINAPSISPNPPTVAQLLCLQTANTNTFSNGQQNQLSAIPQSNSKYTFTPYTPAAPTSLSFSNVTSSSMRLSWNDIADNELGYAIYRSNNGGVTYTFIRQLAAGSTYSDESALIANTTYYWKVHAVTEGWLSSPLSGSYATLPAASFISAQTGNWNTGATWVGGTVPSTNADVTIDNGDIVTLDVNASLNLLTIGQGASGTLRIGNDATARTLAVTGDLTINNGATLDVNTAFAQTGHTITLSGNLINNSTLNLGPNASSAAGITFNNPSGMQTISGAGPTTNFYTINVNVGATSSDILEVASSNFSSLSTGFLTLTTGTFKLSTGVTITPFSGSQAIPSLAGLWINHSSAVVNTTGGDLSVAGLLQTTAGTLNIGNAANNRLMYSGGTFTIEGGSINVAGRIERANITTIIKFNMSGGVLTVPTVSSTSTTVSPVELTVVGSTFAWSDGSIIVQREGGSGAQDLGYVNTLTNFTVTGGTLQIGNSSTPAAQRMNINSNPYLYNIFVNNANATGILVGNNTILGNINVASGVLETTLNGLANFNGIVQQNINTISPIIFNNLTLNNISGLALSGSITVTRNLTLTNGPLSIGASTLTFHTSDNPIIRTSGTITTSASSNLVFGTSGNTGGAAFTIPAGTFTTTPDSINNFTINRTNNLTLNNQMMLLNGILLCNGPLTTNGNLTLLSTAVQTALIDGSSTGQVSGNVTMQRYLPSGFGYKYISSPFQAATVNEFSNDLDLGASFPTFYNYDENRTSSGWVSYTTTTNLLTPLQGYAANFGSDPAAKTADVTGAVNNGNLSVTLYNHDSTFTKGFNLAGNPYPSPINWDAASGWTKTNIDNALYYFQAGTTDQYTGTYSTYINGISSDGLATNIIPSMQGFFVHVTDGSFPVTGTLGIANSVRTNDLTHAFLKTMKADTLPLLRITAGFADDGTPSDPAVIYFDSSATQLFDKNLDALKLMNTDILVPNLYAMTSDSERLSISAIPFPVDSIGRVSIGLKTAKDGWITFKAGDIKLMPADRYIYLTDAEAGINQDMKINSNYRLFLKAGVYENRFSLAFSSTVLNNIPAEFSLLQNYPNPFNPRTTIKYSIPQASFVSITVYDLLGREISKLVNEEKQSGSYEVQFDGSKLSSGVYFYRLHAGNVFKTKKLLLLK